jgi:atypical dual specificity phosphatase
LDSKSTPVLDLAEFGVSFGKRVVLDGITLSLLPNGIDVLMGPVKSGKSTLFRTLSGLYEGHSLHKCWGSVLVAGEAMTLTNRPALVQQHAKVFEQSLLDALLDPIRTTQKRTPAEWRAQAAEWLSEFGLPEAVALLDQPLLHCSSRIQRSVMILSQALLKPPVLMIDEPTFGLDDLEATRLTDFLKKIAESCKLLISLHNQMQARRMADRILLIGGGRVLAYQDTQGFFTNPDNEWVTQFTRTGSLSLPSPDAKPHDLEADTPPPPPLSQAAQAVQAAKVTPVEQVVPAVPAIQPVPEVVKAEPVAEKPAQVVMPVQVVTPVQAVVTAPVAPAPVIAPVLPPVEAPAMRAPVQLPPPSQDGIELASMVGEVMLRDSSAPRGFNWIIPGKLAGCPAPGVSAPIDYDLSLLSRVGITRLITLTEEDLDQEALHRHDLKNTHLPIIDREAPSIGQTHMLLVRMQNCIAAGDILAVHCKAGLGRTGTILAAWLIRDGGLSAEGAMARLRRIEPGFIQSEIQEDFLRRYEADLTSRMI